jgi:outer membrane protein insertion porin family
MKKKLILFLFVSCMLLQASEIIIEAIVFEGNTIFSDQKLSSAIVSKKGMIFQQKIALKDAQRLADFFQENGYYLIKVFPPETVITETGKIIVKYQIEEQKNMLIDTIQLEGNIYLETETILAQVNQSNQTLHSIPNVLQSIVEFYSNQGFLFAKVNVDSISTQEDKLNVKIIVDEGNYCRFEDYIFRGNKITKESTLLQISQINTVRTITPNVLQIAQENLRKKPYISQAEIIPLNHKTALLEIKETNMSYFSGILGYDNREKQTNRLNGFLSLEFLNLYGTDRSLAFHWQKLSTDRTSIELSYHEAGIRQIPIAGDVTILREEVDSTYIATHFELELYRYSIFMKYGLYYGFEDIFPGRAKIIDKTNFQRIGFFGQYQNLDYSLNPRKGNEFSVRYYTIFNKVEDKKITKQAVESSYFQVFPVAARLYFTTKLSAKLIQNKEITDYEYFYLGGNSTLRGFMENQFYGYRTGLINMEFRYLLGKDTRFFLFTDYGYVENSFYRYGKLFGFGFGLRIATRLGLFGFDYGFGYQERLRNPLEGIVHFGIETKL